MWPWHSTATAAVKHHLTASISVFSGRYCAICAKRSDTVQMCVGPMQCFNNVANEGNLPILGSVTSRDGWCFDCYGEGEWPCLLKIDTGADINGLPDSVYNSLSQRPQLQTTKPKLYGVGMSLPAVKWKITANPITAKKTTVHPMYILADVKRMLNCPASVALGLATRVAVVPFASVKSVKQQFPQLFNGLGRLEGSI